MAKQLWLSYSGAGAWRACEQKYWYSYIHKIRRKAVAPPLELGSWLHSYLERFYKAAKRGAEAERCHEFALTNTVRQYAKYFKSLASAADAAGETEVAQDILDMTDKAKGIAQRYYDLRGAEDIERYEILHIEVDLKVKVDKDIVLPGIADLIVRDRETGEHEAWDHKSTGRIPRSDSHLLDMQLVLYAAGLELSIDLKIDQLVWNYLRTKEPTVPKIVNKGKSNESLSRAAIDSDQETYLAAIEANGLNPADYAPILNGLKDTRKAVFYPRHRLPFLAEAEAVVLRDFIRTAHDIEKARSNPNFIPVRNVGRDCDWCDYNKLCRAVLSGGDEEPVIQQSFKRG